MRFRIKLAYKLFFTLLFTSTSIIFMIGIMQYYSSAYFKDYVNRVRMEKLTEMADKMAAKYREYGSWDPLRTNPAIFIDMVRTHGIQISFPPSKEAKKTQVQTILRFGEQMSIQFRDAARGKLTDSDDNDDGEIHTGIQHFSSTTVLKRMREPGEPDDFLIDPRKRIGIVLLNIKKSPIMGPPIPSDAMMLKAIKADGKIVGFLGIPKVASLTTPLESAFLKRQFQLFCFVGGLILALIIALSTFLSRHIVIPIRKLAKGAKKVEERRFDTFIDIRTGDELENLAEDFNHMIRTLKQYEEMREQWMVDISHELRTPLTVLRGEIEAMLDGIRIPDEYSLTSLHSEIIRLNRLVEDLRLLSVSDSTAMVVNKSAVEPVQIINDTINIYMNRFNMAHMEVRTKINADRNIKIMGDKDRLTQLFSNICENALKYADKPGALHVDVMVEHGEFLLIGFEDSGPGVPQESLTRLFDRLYRVDKSRSRELGGTGLGLSIVKHIVERHNGKVGALNGKMGGLRIEIRLPLKLN